MIKTKFLFLTGILILSQQLFGGTWIQVSGSGPGRIDTYDGGGRFGATLYGSANSTTPTGTLQVTCVDFLNVFSSSDRWEVNFTNLDGSGNLADTRYGGTYNGNGAAANFDHYNSGAGALDALSRYRAAAWLTTKIVEYQNDATQRAAVQGAIWYLLDPLGAPNAPQDGGNFWTASQANWLNQAITTGLSQSTSFYSKFRIVSQVNIGHLGNGYNTRYQEFITTVTPEPSTYALLFLAMGFVVYAARRRKAAEVGPLA